MESHRRLQHRLPRLHQLLYDKNAGKIATRILAWAEALTLEAHHA